jgi:hypothetical protein
MTEANVEYLKRQRDGFLSGTPGPDFPGGVGESNHVGRPTQEDLRAESSPNALRAMGLDKFVAARGDTLGAQQVVEAANAVLAS